MKRIQIQLTNKKLDDVVREMAAAAAETLDGKIDPKRTAGAHAAIRKVLEKYVHAYETCGLATVCHEAQEIDAWDAKGQDED